MGLQMQNKPFNSRQDFLNYCMDQERKSSPRGVIIRIEKNMSHEEMHIKITTNCGHPFIYLFTYPFIYGSIQCQPIFWH